MTRQAFMLIDRGAVGLRLGRIVLCCAVIPAVLSQAPRRLGARRPTPRKSSPAGAQATRPDFRAVRLAVTDLIETFGAKYPRGHKYLARLASLEAAARSGDPSSGSKLRQLRREALLDNPLLDFDKLLVLKRRRGQLGLPVNHKCNSGINRTGYDNEIAVLSPVRPNGGLQTLFRPKGTRFVGEIDLHFDADRLLFTMPVGGSWQIFEIGADGSGLRQVSRGEHPDVDNFDACYLPDGGIVFASTASFHAVPCWHGKERACSIYRMDGDGGSVRQLCFDQDLDLHPAVLPTGQVIFSRWDYTGTMHMYLRPLMVMNPDGTGQRAIYGSNSYWPNALYFPRGIPGAPGKVVAIAAGYHGVPRMGVPVLIDTNRGQRGGDGVLQFIPGRNKPVDDSVIQDRWYDKTWPKFLHPLGLSEKYFFVAMQPTKKLSWGIYLVDVFDNVLPLLVDGRFDFFEPIPIQKVPRPPVIPNRVDPSRKDAVVYLHNVYAGEGLAGVPHGTVKRLRIVAYHFGYPGLAGPDKIGSGGPWEVMRILGTVPVHADGSAVFRVPARTPISLQPLDAEGKAVQLMRSWYTAMPGESVSCVGCHEQAKDTPVVRSDMAMGRTPSEIEPWYGPARGLDFERDVQPALDKYCVACHHGRARTDARRIPDLRSELLVSGYKGRQLTPLAAGRLHPAVRKALGGQRIRYTPAYEALLPYVRRVGIEDDVNLLVAGEYHADTSELIQMLRKGHHNVRLDREAWDRLITWIDLNAPCHGTWGEVAPIPDGAAGRRRELLRQYAGGTDDPEAVPNIRRPKIEPVIPKPTTRTRPPVPTAAGWPFGAAEARRRQAAAGAPAKTIDLGDGVRMNLVRIPAGPFVMGDPRGDVDERPLAAVVIRKPFWMGVCEVTNTQFRRFDAAHDSGYFMQRYPGMDGPGLSLDGARQPVIRVSWRRARGFCRWLSKRTGMKFTLPTEAQWEYACRAGSSAALGYGTVEADFSGHANLADKALSRQPEPTGGLRSNISAHPVRGILLSAVYGGNILCESRFDDKAVATADVGRYRPNAWGLHDMHGNATEWTRTAYRPYPYRDDGRDDAGAGGRKVVRGGSWCDRPKRCRSAFRLNYPAWQAVYNVGFRVVAEYSPATPKAPAKKR